MLLEVFERLQAGGSHRLYGLGSLTHAHCLDPRVTRAEPTGVLRATDCLNLRTDFTPTGLALGAPGTSDSTGVGLERSEPGIPELLNSLFFCELRSQCAPLDCTPQSLRTVGGLPGVDQTASILEIFEDGIRASISQLEAGNRDCVQVLSAYLVLSVSND